MSDEGRNLTKWQVALAVGASVTAVVGVSLLTYVLCRRRENARRRVSRAPRGPLKGSSAVANGPERVGTDGNVKNTTENEEPGPKVCFSL
jgi:hypothetical protein